MKHLNRCKIDRKPSTVRVDATCSFWRANGINATALTHNWRWLNQHFVNKNFRENGKGIGGRFNTLCLVNGMQNCSKLQHTENAASVRDWTLKVYILFRFFFGFFIDSGHFSDRGYEEEACEDRKWWCFFLDCVWMSSMLNLPYYNFLCIPKFSINIHWLIGNSFIQRLQNNSAISIFHYDIVQTRFLAKQLDAGCLRIGASTIQRQNEMVSISIRFILATV